MSSNQAERETVPARKHSPDVVHDDVAVWHDFGKQLAQVSEVLNRLCLAFARRLGIQSGEDGSDPDRRSLRAGACC